jgi:hypothetical protein
MMHEVVLKSIHTDRHFERRSFYEIVYEWEDELAEALHLPIVHHNHKFYNKELAVKVLNKWHLYRPFQLADKLLESKGKVLYFDMGPRFTFSTTTSSNIIPLIIDFWKSYDVKRFNRVYRNCRVVYISSLEVYQYLKTHGCTVPIHLLPLSLPDKYKISTNEPYKKEIDIISVGRSNPVLAEFLEKLVIKFPYIKYLVQVTEKGRTYFKGNTADTHASTDTRASYIELIKLAKIAFYSTPGIDGGEKRTGGFNPVTPRLFELLYAGCYLVGRYPKTEETDFFRLPEICPSVEHYDQFENIILSYLSEQKQPLEKNDLFLRPHYTSQRAIEIKKMFKINE